MGAALSSRLIPYSARVTLKEKNGCQQTICTVAVMSYEADLSNNTQRKTGN